MGKQIKMDSKNNKKFQNHVIKRAHKIHAEKEKDQIKMKDYILDRQVTPPTFLYFIEWGCLKPISLYQEFNHIGMCAGGIASRYDKSKDASILTVPSK